MRSDVIVLRPRSRDAVKNKSKVPADCLIRLGTFLERSFEILKYSAKRIGIIEDPPIVSRIAEEALCPRVPVQGV